ncbi:MAG: VOC family protein [Pseudomonadota bacterium]
MIDHLVLGCADLEEGRAWLRREAQIELLPGGSHPGRGTCNALGSLGAGCYLELLAPDPEQGVPVVELASLAQPALVHWAVRATPLHQVHARAQDVGCSTAGPADWERHTASGALLRWQLLFLAGHGAGAAMPFFIDWLDSPHPSQATSPCGELLGLQVSSPQAERVRDVIGDDLPLAVLTTAAEPALRARLQTHAGEVLLDAASPFPQGLA